MAKISIGITGLQEVVGRDFGAILDVARRADDLGLDQVSVAEHVAMSASGHAGRAGFPHPVDYEWYEPFAVLSAVAAVTRRIRLTSGVVIAPLRPAILLAKQLATLDVISKGRVEIGLGTGWLKDEFDASNIPFEGRFDYLEEQVEICRTLWRGAPASHHGRRVSFDDFYSLPLPVQRGGIPIWLGLYATDRSLDRIARIADGWVVPWPEPEVIAKGVATIKTLMAKYGRDPDAMEFRVELPAVAGRDGEVDVEASLAGAGVLIEAGATIIGPWLSKFVKRPEQVGPLLERLATFRAEWAGKKVRS